MTIQSLQRGEPRSALRSGVSTSRNCSRGRSWERCSMPAGPAVTPRPKNGGSRLSAARGNCKHCCVERSGKRDGDSRSDWQSGTVRKTLFADKQRCAQLPLFTGNRIKYAERASSKLGTRVLLITDACGCKCARLVDDVGAVALDALA